MKKILLITTLIATITSGAASASSQNPRPGFLGAVRQTVGQLSARMIQGHADAKMIKELDNNKAQQIQTMQKIEELRAQIETWNAEEVELRKKLERGIVEATKQKKRQALDDEMEKRNVAFSKMKISERRDQEEKYMKKEAEITKEIEKYDQEIRKDRENLSQCQNQIAAAASKISQNQKAINELKRQRLEIEERQTTVEQQYRESKGQEGTLKMKTKDEIINTLQALFIDSFSVTDEKKGPNRSMRAECETIIGQELTRRFDVLERQAATNPAHFSDVFVLLEQMMHIAHEGYQALQGVTEHIREERAGGAESLRAKRTPLRVLGEESAEEALFAAMPTAQSQTKETMSMRPDVVEALKNHPFFRSVIATTNPTPPTPTHGAAAAVPDFSIEILAKNNAVMTKLEQLRAEIEALPPIWEPEEKK